MADAGVELDAQIGWLAALGMGIPAASLLMTAILYGALQSSWPVLVALVGLVAGPALAAWAGKASGRFAAVWFCTVAPLSLVAAFFGREALASERLSFVVLGLLTLVCTAIIFPAGVGIAMGTAIGAWHSVGWRMVGLLAAYVAIAAAVGLTWKEPIHLSSGHSDAEMIDNFRQHEQEFDRLVAMSNQDPKVVRIAPRFTWLDDDYNWPRPPTRIGFSTQRWDEYRQLFRDTGVRDGLARRDHGAVFLFYWNFGIVPSGGSKGYAYSATPPTPLLDSLEEIPTSEDLRHTVYRRISGDWYLFYEAN